VTNEITIAHSPDSDDAFMFYAIAEQQIDLGELKIYQVMKDIQSLNLEALSQAYDVTAISFAAYKDIDEQYILMPCGGSFGINYGPILISQRPLSGKSLENATIAIPGKQTSAYLTLQIFHPNLKVVEHPFDQIESAVANGDFDAGLLIHEGQLTYERLGLIKIVDLGEWWHQSTNLPLPLGGNAIRKNLGREMIGLLTSLLKKSIVYSLQHRAEALAYAAQFARNMPAQLLDKYVGMYVNELTVDCGETGRKAVRLFFERAYQSGAVDRLVVPEYC
jgi:1,4-dihydroxy-6-naphthoate synthase